MLHTVEFYSPSVGGAQEVVRQISERLARRGHEVTVATTQIPERRSHNINGVRIVDFPISGNTVRGFQGPTSEYQSFLRHGDFDVMMNYAAQQWTADLAFPLLDHLSYPKVLAPCGFSGLHDRAYRDYFAKLPRVLSKYDRLVLHSESYRDAKFVKQHGLPHWTLIPNGAAQEEFEAPVIDFRTKYRIPRDVPLLLTVGSHVGTKGHSLAIEALVRARLKRAVLVIVGNIIGSPGCLPKCRAKARMARLRTWGKRKVMLLDPPRTDVVAAFRAADLFVFGSELECSPIVLFEAMASRLPFLTTACGNAEEIVQWSGAGQVVPTLVKPNGWVTALPEVVARHIEELMADEGRRKRMAASGYGAWRQRFTWQKVALDFEQVYREVADHPESSSPATLPRASHAA